MGVAGKSASSSDSGKQGWGGGTEIVSEDVPIPNQHAGVIIGKGGNTIKDLQQRTGCKVQVSQKDEVGENDTRLVCSSAPADILGLVSEPHCSSSWQLLVQVMLRGTKEQVAAVKTLVQELITGAETGTAGGYVGPDARKYLP